MNDNENEKQIVDISKSIAPYWNDIIKYVTHGGTLTGYCEENNLEYSEVSEFSASMPMFKRQLNQAIKLRDNWVKERAMQELLKLSTLDVSEAYDSSGEPLPVTAIPDSIKKAITQIERKVFRDKDGQETITTKLRFTDKLKSIETLLKMHGLLAQKHEVTVAKTLEDLLTESMDKEANEQE